MAALGCPVAEALVKIKQFVKGGPAEHIHDALVVFRPLLCQAVGAVLLQPVGQVSAADDHGAPVQLFRRLPDQLAQMIVVRQREAGQPDPDQAIIRKKLIYIIQGDEGSVIQFRISLAQRTGRKALCGSSLRKSL